MKLKLIIAFLLCLLLVGCNKNDTEEVVFGDIDETATYGSDVPLESLVKRKDKFNVSDYFQKIPMTITSDVVKSELPDVYNNVYKIDRIQLNNVYFDMNEIANQNVYNYYIDNGFFKLDIVVGESKSINITVAQISNEDTNLIDEDSSEYITDIVNEYEDIYLNDPNQVSDEYGSYYTYDKYIDFFNEHENLKKDISIYDKNDILQFIIDMYGLKYTPEDFLSNENCGSNEYSDWYEVTHDFWLANSDKENIDTKITVKRNTDGVFVFMVEYPKDFTIDEITGKDYFTPNMIVNIAQNNYYQLAESYDNFIIRNNNLNNSAE